MKKFLQKTLALLALAVMFMASGSAWADTTTFDVSANSGNIAVGTPITSVDGNISIVWSYVSSVDGNSTNKPAQFAFSGSYGYYLELVGEFTFQADGYNITSIAITAPSSGYYGAKNMTIVSGGGTYTASSNDRGTWEGSSSSISFKTVADPYGNRYGIYATSITVTYEEAAPTEPIEYHVNFTGDVPAGCSATLDGQNFTANGTKSEAKNYREGDLQITTTEDYYADVNYNSGEHTWTVQFKHWYIYNVITNNNEGRVGMSEWKANGEQIKSTTTIPAGMFSALDLDGWDESISVTPIDEYHFNVTATYTESADIPYSIVLVNAPAGASVTVKEDQTFTENGTYNCRFTLTASDFTYVVPDGYKATANYDAVNHIFTVTYAEKVIPTAPWNTNFADNFSDYKVIDANNDGKTWTSVNGYIRYSYNGASAADDYFVLTPVHLEAGRTYNVAVNCYSQSTSWGPETMEVVYGLVDEVESLTNIAIPNTDITWTSWANLEGQFVAAATGNYYFALHATTPQDRYWLHARTFSIVDVTPEPVEAPEFPEEGVAYEIKNIGLDKYINIKEHATEAGYVADEKERLYFTWDEMEAGFTITDEEGNYLGKSTANGWNISSTTPEYWTVEEVSTGVYAFKSQSSNYLAPNKNDGTDNRLMRDLNSSFHYTFTIEEFVVPAVGSFNMSAAGYATLCLNEAWTVPGGYTAYTAGKDDNGEAVLVEDGEIVLTQITDVPANVGVILQGPAAPDIEVFAPASAPVAPAVNFLIGNSSNDAQNWTASAVSIFAPGAYDSYGADAQLYQLAKENEKVGFYRQVADGSTLECAAHKAFLVVPASVAAASNGRLLFPGQDDVTGINAIATENAEAIYNLQGQRVNAAKAGVYVKNGKKFIVK